ncbi:MAG: type II toxin-antitoxin system HicA family toxin [Ktedonobacterales bacterium]
MGERLPRITAAECLKALDRDGWHIVRQSGSHAHLKHPTKLGRVTVLRHVGMILKPKTLEAILDQAGLSVDDLRKLLWPGGGMSEHQYTILLQSDLDEGGFTVTVPALPGVVTQGETLEEAIAMARDAIRLHIESLIADGDPVPEEAEHLQALVITVAA